MTFKSLRGFGRGFTSLARFLPSARPKLTHESILRGSILFLILLLAFSVRLLPIRWGIFLSEFDPYFQYHVTRYMVNNGVIAWLNWHDNMRWYPYGHDVAKHSYPGLPLTAFALYKVLQATLGSYVIPLYDFCVFFPVIFGTLACLALYFLGRDVGGEAVGLLAAFLLALSPPHILRTSLGFFDDETVGIFSILLFMWAFLRSLDGGRSQRAALGYSISSGLLLGYICASWGASLYPIAITAFFTFILILTGRYERRLLISYGLTFGIGLLIAVNVPKLGLRFLISSAVVPALGVLGMLCICEVLRYVRATKWRVLFFASAISSAAALYYLLLTYKFIHPIGRKFLGVLNPSLRFEQPLFASVAEHQLSAWGTFYYSFGVGIIFFPVGVFFAARDLSRRNLYLLIYGLSALYAASSLIRLEILLAPALCLLWAIAVVRLVGPFITLLKERTPTFRRRRVRAYLGKEFSGVILIILFLLLTFTFVTGTDFIRGPQAQGPRTFLHAYSPVTMAAASMPIRPNEPILDWYYALIWMRENLPEDAVVCSWWDYGYWISIVANKRTLADNGTGNMTQIKMIATMFLSNETEAIKILKRYNVTHVVVFVTFTTQKRFIGYGEESKWRWMAKIAGLNETEYYNNNKWTEKGKQTVIYKMMQYGMEKTLMGYSTITLEHFKEARLQGVSHGGIIPLICIYEVEY